MKKRITCTNPFIFQVNPIHSFVIEQAKEQLWWSAATTIATKAGRNETTLPLWTTKEGKLSQYYQQYRPVTSFINATTKKKNHKQQK